tara:strand:- start:25 stop:270 length:246 start_codon:yes stop_codon:yes gene_type:complete
MEKLKKYKKTIVLGLLIAGGVVACFQFNSCKPGEDSETAPNTEVVDSTETVTDTTIVIPLVDSLRGDHSLENLDNELNDQE